MLTMTNSLEWPKLDQILDSTWILLKNVPKFNFPISSMNYQAWKWPVAWRQRISTGLSKKLNQNGQRLTEICLILLWFYSTTFFILFKFSDYCKYSQNNSFFFKIVKSWRLGDLNPLDFNLFLIQGTPKLLDGS